MNIIERIYAQKTDLGAPIGGTGQGLGPFAGNATDITYQGAVTGLTQVTKTVSSIIGVMTVAAGIWFVFNLVVAGIQYISAGGDKHNLEEAQKRITNALIGIVIVAASWSILALTGKFLGYDILIGNVTKIILSLFPGQ